MTKRRQAKDEGLRSHYLVRVVLPGALLHLASWDKPTWGIDADGQRTLLAEWIDDPAYGDTIVSVDWAQVVAVTFRWSE